MKNSSFLDALVGMEQSTERIYKKIGGLEIEFFIQPATIFDVEDPENLSRVRVLFGENSTDAKSDWLPMLNNGRGRISSQYLGAKCLVGAVAGNTDNAVVFGLFNDTTANQVISTAPVVVPIIDVSDISNINDPGVKCNQQNEGRTYIFSGNVSQDLKVCIRRNNRQKGPDEDVWEWKNLTRGLIVEKETDPKQAEESSVVHDKKPVPKCKQELEGELIQFTEDRDFRQIPMICKKDENEEWAWVPAAAAPTYFKTTLPKCTEKIHGQTVAIDDGNNSEFAICARFDKAMKWVKYGTRIPVKFSNKPAPPTKSEVLKSVKPNSNLNIEPAAQLASAATKSPVVGNKNLTNAVFQQAAAGAIKGITSDALSKASSMVSALPATDAGVKIAQQIGSRILTEGGLGVDQLSAVLSSGDLGTAGNLISSLGPQAEQIIREGGADVAQILSAAGTEALITSLSRVSPEAAGVFNSFMVGGPQGALDSAVQYGLDLVPAPANEVFSQVVNSLDLNNAPAALSSLLSSATSGGLSDIVGGIAGGIDFNGVNVGGLVSQLSSGSLGDVSKIFQDFGNLQSLASFVPGLPSSASALMGAIGLGGPLAMALPGGIGVSAVTSLLGGSNPLSSILGGGGAFGALGGLFGGGSNPCPCLPSCRKVEHGVDSDGNKLLDPAGNLTLNNTNVYGSDVLNNNSTCLAAEVGVKPTGIGLPLIPKNPLDFTAVIKSIPRVDELSKKLEDAIKGGAEAADIGLEMVYSMEAIEKTFKISDNNISMMEWIQRLELIGSQNFMNNLITGKKGGLLGDMTRDMVEHSVAINDLYRMVKELNAVKDGGRAETSPTPALIANKKNPVKIPKYFSKSRVSAIINLIKQILEGLSMLASLDPVFGTPFKNLKTRNTQSKVLNDSLSSKFNLNQPTEDSLNYVFQDFNTSGIRSLSTNQLDSGEFNLLLEQIKNEQERASRGEGSCS